MNMFVHLQEPEILPCGEFGQRIDCDGDASQFSSTSDAQLWISERCSDGLLQECAARKMRMLAARTRFECGAIKDGQPKCLGKGPGAAAAWESTFVDAIELDRPALSMAER